MTGWYISESNAEPAEFEAASSQTTVYQRRNIHRVQREREDEKYDIWEYEERKMTRLEYAQLLSGRIAEQENALCDIDEVNSVSKAEVEEALCEIDERIAVLEGRIL